MMPWADRIGSTIERAWRSRDYERSSFSGLATTVLSEAKAADLPDLDDIVNWVLAGQGLPQQENPAATFGQPPVTVYRAKRFYIEALFWTDGTTTVHQHAFSGAFRVLAGSSIETRFSFELERPVDGHFVAGRLHVASSSLLRTGDVRAIEGGSRMIHSLFHLERPSITIVARTYRDPNAGPQFDYALPGVGHDPFFMDVARDRALHVISMLRTVEHPKFETFVSEAIRQSDLHTGYRLLKECSDLPNRDLFERLLTQVADADFRTRFRDAFSEERRLKFLRSRRVLVQDPALRFFLGVLMNAQTRRDALDLVHSRDARVEPEVQVATWLAQLSRVTAKLQVGGMAWEPNLLGLPEFTDQREQQLACVLSGGSPDDDGETTGFLGRLRSLPPLACLFQ
jgi:hypothetical protein